MPPRINQRADCESAALCLYVCVWLFVYVYVSVCVCVSMCVYMGYDWMSVSLGPLWVEVAWSGCVSFPTAL